MGSGSEVVGKDEKKKYQIYVEEYVLSYLRRESDSLELSEIYFYGSRQENGRKFYVYGAGRDRGIAAFAGYEPLPELVCRLTQAGPVFLVRESDGECRTTGFQIFYDNNEAMQNYLLEWTGSTGKTRAAEKKREQEPLPVPVVIPKEEKRRTPHGAMSVQLCLILVVLVAIVITSTDSYDKMEELNRSAKEVFFAIENQEAGEPARGADSGGQAEGRTQTAAGDSEIVVERDTGMSGKTERDSEVADGRKQAADTAADGELRAADSGAEELEGAEAQEEGVLKSAQQISDGAEAQNSGKEAGEDQAQETDDANSQQTAASDAEENSKEDGKETAEQGEEENEEALSRNITRYYEVEQGDTLYTISQKIYGDISRVEKICEINEISDPDKIRFGQRIILP